MLFKQKHRKRSIRLLATMPRYVKLTMPLIFRRGLLISDEVISNENQFQTGELLLSHVGSDELKLCDFGLSRRIHLNQYAALHYGMPEFVAPEVASGEGVSFGADMWSVGIITYILLSGRSPFKGLNDRETLTRVREGKWEW